MAKYLASHRYAPLVRGDRVRKVVLVGNTNVGKSVIFSRLTDRYVDVSNYPGTTVEVTRGETEIDGRVVELIDTPGINSLIPVSEDERITRDLLFLRRPSAVLQVADAKNVRRALMLTTQLAEAGLPVVLALNMSDEARLKGIDLDTGRLSRILGIDVVGTVAVAGQGIETLKEHLGSCRVSRAVVDYGELEEDLEAVAHLIRDTSFPARGTGLMLLAGDTHLEEMLGEEKAREIRQIRQRAQGKYLRPLAFEIARMRKAYVDRVASQVEVKEHRGRSMVSERLSQLTMHPVSGILIFLVVLAAVYMFVGKLGAQVVVDFLESTVFKGYVNPWTRDIAHTYIKVPVVAEFLVGPYGLVTMGLAWAVAIVMPIVVTFFLAFSFLEDSGYIPRLSVMIDRVFRRIGLNGKAILPMVLGLGCDTMATMTTRTLETKRERIIATLLLALGIPCSAQLGVIMALFGYASPGAFFIWALVIASQLLVVGYLASRLIKGRSSEFVMEIPPIRLPRVKNVLAKTVLRVEWFFKEVLPFFLIGTAVIFAADKIGVLRMMIEGLKPVVSGLLDLPQETAVAFILGFIRRDYGTAGLFDLAVKGLLSSVQIMVSAVVITLFVPCVANYLMIIKERGLKIALLIVAFIIPYAMTVGAVLNLGLRGLGAGV